MQQILDMLIESDDITWQSIIKNLASSGEIDPWDVNITELSKKYIKVIKTLKEMDFRISGKVLLAAALLLRIKSSKLVDDDINEFDRLIAATEELSEDEFYEDLEHGIVLDENQNKQIKEESFKLMPRTPQPRKRKVTVNDLVNALEKALNVKKKRVIRSYPVSNIRIPERSTDMSLIIRTVYKQIVSIFKNKKNLNFNQLLPSESKLDKVYTFIPLLHLSNQRRIEMIQDKHFGDINIHLLKGARIEQIDEELSLN